MLPPRADSLSRSRALLLVCGLSLCGFPFAASSRFQATGSLDVISEPAGAAVYVDGDLRGRAPIQMPAVSLGDHRVRLVLEGYLDNSRVIRLERGDAVSIRARLIPVSNERASGLRILVVAGEDAINVVQKRTAVAPVVEIRDRNGLPVSGATVTFSLGGSNTASFAGGARALTMTTNAAGRAAVAALNPIASGPVQIEVQAAFQGQAAAATIIQTNVATSVQAAASGAGGAAAGSSGPNTAVLTAAGAGAGVAGAVLGSDNSSAAVNDAPAISSIATSVTNGLEAVTVFIFTAAADDRNNDGMTFTWEFGDGASQIGPTATHVYQAAGTFPVKLTVSDGKLSATSDLSVTVKNVTGTWAGIMTCPPASCGIFVQFPITIQATQNGRTIAGTSRQQVPSFPQDTCTFSAGSIRDDSNIQREVVFGTFEGCSLVGLNYRGCVGRLDDTLTRMLPRGGGSLECDLTRQ